jgi:AraC-like DNA-binding protein
MSEISNHQPDVSAATPSLLGRLLAVGSRRSMPAPTEARRARCQLYKAMLRKWLGMSLTQRIADLERYNTEVTTLSCPPDQRWRDLRLIGDTLPTSLPEEERRVLRADLCLLSRYCRVRYNSVLQADMKARGQVAWRVVSAVTRAQSETGRGALTLKAIATDLRISPRHLGRLFADATGLTFHQYLKAIRLMRAADMLRTPTLSIKEIAAATGYTTPTNFSRDFVRAVGLSPTTYRTVISTVQLTYTPADDSMTGHPGEHSQCTGEI